MEGQFLLSVLIVSGFTTVESSYAEVTLLPCPTGTFSKGTGCIKCHAGTLYSLPCSRFSSHPTRDNLRMTHSVFFLTITDEFEILIFIKQITGCHSFVQKEVPCVVNKQKKSGRGTVQCVTFLAWVVND